MPVDPVTAPERKPRVVVAGQIPPPMGGQNVMIERILHTISDDPTFETSHLPFKFTPDFRTVRSAGVAKIIELFRVLGRLLRLRVEAPIDCLLFPSGGPQNVPIVRDILLLPWMLLASRTVVVQFHAAGIADRIRQRPSLLTRLLAAIYRRADAAIVMTEFNRRDPEALGMKRIRILPHRLADVALPSRAPGECSPRILLSMGHLCPDKGTPALLEAFARLLKDFPDLQLHLGGECLPPFSPEELDAIIARLGIGRSVTLAGVLSGDEKWAAFSAAHLFVFPSIAPYESFGLVLVEAMMAGLPIVASDWRGNRDVVGENFGGFLYPPLPDHAGSLTQALREAVSRSGEWSTLGERNRQIFLAKYNATTPGNEYREALRETIDA